MIKWNGPEDSDPPTSVTKIISANDTQANTTISDQASQRPLYFSIIAVVLSVIAVIVSLIASAFSMSRSSGMLIFLAIAMYKNPEGFQSALCFLKKNT